MSKPDVETVDINGDNAPQGFVSYSVKEDITTKFFDMSALPEVKSIHYISPEETKLFRQNKVQNVVSAIKIRINSCFDVANNVVPFEDVMNMHNVYNNLTESARYNVRIQCQYIAWALKTHLENFNEVKLFYLDEMFHSGMP